MKIFYLGLGLCLLGIFTAHAQITELEKGDKVKLSAPIISEKKIIGNVREVYPTIITLSTNDSVLVISQSTIKWMEVSTGKKRNTLSGAIVGGVTGGFILSIALGTSSNDSGVGPDFSGGTGFTLGALAGLGYGGVLGALVGTFIRTDRWERLPLDVTIASEPYSDKQLSPCVTIRVPISQL